MLKLNRYWGAVWPGTCYYFHFHSGLQQTTTILLLLVRVCVCVCSKSKLKKKSVFCHLMSFGLLANCPPEVKDVVFCPPLLNNRVLIFVPVGIWTSDTFPEDHSVSLNILFPVFSILRIFIKCLCKCILNLWSQSVEFSLFFSLNIFSTESLKSDSQSVRHMDQSAVCSWMLWTASVNIWILESQIWSQRFRYGPGLTTPRSPSPRGDRQSPPILQVGSP